MTGEPIVCAMPADSITLKAAFQPCSVQNSAIGTSAIDPSERSPDGFMSYGSIDRFMPWS